MGVKTEMTKHTVYKHVNKKNGKVYIGMTKNKPTRRWSNGKGYANIGGDFYKDIEKYGWNAFEHIIVAEGLEYDEALRMVTELIGEHRATIPKYGYNASAGGRRGIRGSRNGVSKSVIMMDRSTGEELKRFDTLTDASEYVHGNRSNISSACRNKIKSAYGYLWKYA